VLKISAEILGIRVNEEHKDVRLVEEQMQVNPSVELQ
jgi:hypothetical protein